MKNSKPFFPLPILTFATYTHINQKLQDVHGHGNIPFIEETHHYCQIK